LVRTEACRRHVEMLHALPWLGWRCARLSRGCHQRRETWWDPGEMRCDDLCTSADVGTLGERVERAYGDWLSAAVVGIAAWRCWGMIVKSPKRQGMRVLGR
jgi:hypothetical protein